jgi:flagellin
LIADSPYKLNDGSYHTHIGSMTMLIRVSPDDTIEKIKDKLSKIRGLDIDAGNQSTNTPSHTYYYATVYEQDGVIIDSPVYQSIIELNIQNGANENQAIKLIYKSLNLHSLGISSTNSLTKEASESAISQIANALSIVSEQRSIFGAYQNRLEHARYNVDNMSENTQSAESKIRDTDMVKEIVEYSKQQILQQTLHSLFSQANQMPERVLALLK